MNREEIVLKEMRVSEWEKTRVVSDMAELKNRFNDENSFVVGDFFDYLKDSNGNFMLIDNRMLSI